MKPYTVGGAERLCVGSKLGIEVIWSGVGPSHHEESENYQGSHESRTGYPSISLIALRPPISFKRFLFYPTSSLLII